MNASGARRPRGGFSFAEALVALAVAATALSAVLFLFRSSRDSAGGAEELAGTLHQGRMLLEQLKRDLRCLLPPGESAPPESTAAGDRVELSIARDGGGTPDRVVWSFDKASGRVRRASDADGERVYGAPRARVRAFAVRRRDFAFAEGGVGAFELALELDDGSDDPRGSVTLAGKVHPPALRARDVAAEARR